MPVAHSFGSEPGPAARPREGPEQLDRAKSPLAFGCGCQALHEKRQSYFVSGAKDLADKMKRLR